LFFLFVESLAQKLQVDRNGPQRVLYFVGDARGESGKAGKVFSAAQPDFPAAFFGYIFYINEGAGYMPLIDKRVHADREQASGAGPLSLDIHFMLQHPVAVF